MAAGLSADGTLLYRMERSANGTQSGSKVRSMRAHEEERVTFVTLYARIVYELASAPSVSQEALARKLDVTMRTVQRHLDALEREGYVRVIRERKPFTYEIVWSRTLPYFRQLRVVTFMPDMIDRLADMER